MCWCAGLSPLMDPVSSLWGIECSPGDSESHSSCHQVTFADHFMSIYDLLLCFMAAECESMIRRILVLDPLRRYTIQQIKEHPWMQAEVSDFIRTYRQRSLHSFRSWSKNSRTNFFVWPCIWQLLYFSYNRSSPYKAKLTVGFEQRRITSNHFEAEAARITSK